MKSKIVAMYLPQYHEVKENSEFWGEGFTDWVSVKKANPLYEGHNQPQIPLNDNYYDLSQKESIKWQIGLAKKYGIYGFGIYHYWFSNDKVLLTKPAELILENKDLDIPFFFAWDNASWRRTWSKFRGNAWAPLQDAEKKSEGKGKKESSILIEYVLGTEKDWENHFNYLLPYFKDDRYIKQDNKPVFEIFNYSSEIKKMADCWNDLAKQNGFDGVLCIYKNSALYSIPEGLTNFNYEPPCSGWGSSWEIWTSKILSILGLGGKDGPKKYSYEKVWENIICKAQKRTSVNEWHSAFVTYDDTPRRGKQGRVITGASPDKFKAYLRDLVKINEEQGKEFILLTAWNEWGEGAVLEPSEENEYAYLEAVSAVMSENGSEI